MARPYARARRPVEGKVVIMPYVVQEGVRIHYRVECSRAPLVLPHAFTSRLDRWYDTAYV